MANKLKNSFGKNLLRLSSMLIAVLMLVLTVFVDTAPINVQAEELGSGNTIKVTSANGAEIGQIVVLEAGKTYSFSYYYSGE